MSHKDRVSCPLRICHRQQRPRCVVKTAPCASRASCVAAPMEDRASAPLRLCHCPFCGVGRARPHGGRGARRARAARRGVGTRARGLRRIARGTPHRRARMASRHARSLVWDRSINGSLRSGGVQRRREGGTSDSSLFKSTTKRSNRHRRARCCATRCDATRRRPRASRPASRRRCCAASASSGGGSPRWRRPSSSRRVM